MNNNVAAKINVEEKIKKYKKKSQFGELWGRFARNKTAVLGLIIIVLLILMMIFADVMFDYKTQVIKQNIPMKLKPPSAAHPFGTDEMGRDILARVVHGSRVSLLVSFISCALSLVAGGIIGAISGYFGGKLDNVIMRIMDIFLAIPGVLFAITIVAALGSSMVNLVIALSISAVPRFARIVRGSVLTIRDMEFIEAARAIGATNTRIIIQHVLVNCMAPIIVQTTLQVASVILTTASLSFLGLGVKAPTPEWGALLSSGRTYIRDYSYITMFPGLAIMITILALNLFGDGLRDALDPRLK